MEPTYVTFDQAKLLKEKGFDESCKHYYDLNFKELTFHVEDSWKNSEIKNGYPKDIFEKLGKHPMISSPEQWKVIEWLRVNYGIWVEVNHCGTFNEFAFKICKLNKKNVKTEPHHISDFSKGWSSPQEAYSAAFDYILKELILK
jgi:hypothetical protein